MAATKRSTRSSSNADSSSEQGGAAGQPSSGATGNSGSASRGNRSSGQKSRSRAGQRSASSAQRAGGSRGGSRSGGRKTSKAQGQRRQQQSEQGVLTRSMGTLRDARSQAYDSVKQHPLSALLVGAGLGYLATYGVRRALPADLDVGAMGRSAAQTIRSKVSEAAEYAKEGTANLGEYAGEGLTTVRSAMRTGTQSLGKGVERGYDYSREALTETWDQHPLMVCAAALVLGAAAGLLLPRP